MLLTFSTRLPFLVLISLLVLACNNEEVEPTADGLGKTVETVRELLGKGDAPGLASHYVIQESENKADALQSARKMLKEVPEGGFLLRDLRISGNMGVVLLADSTEGPPYPVWTRWEDGGWKFFSNFTIWGNTNQIEDFGLSKKEMDHAYKLELWALARVPKKN